MALIGISGKMSSGKDEVGKRLQHLLTRPDMGFESFCLLDDYERSSKWKIKKFAGKVKEIASILTGIPEEDFEKREVKESFLGPEWSRQSRQLPKTWYTYDSIAYFANHVKVPLEDYIKKFKKIDENVYIYIEEKTSVPMTVREMLQIIGTNAIRDRLHPDAWVNAMFADYKLVSQKLITVDFTKNTLEEYPETVVTEVPNWIITDVRFENEAEAIKKRGGILIRVSREASDSMFSVENSVLFNPEIPKLPRSRREMQHESETALDHYKGFDFLIKNNYGLKELQKSLHYLVKFKLMMHFPYDLEDPKPWHYQC